jgi:hypothetical protein
MRQQLKAKLVCLPGVIRRKWITADAVRRRTSSAILGLRNAVVKIETIVLLFDLYFKYRR